MPTSSVSKTSQAAKRTPKTPQVNGAVNGHIPSPYEIMAGRIANRVAEMAENMTFVERERPQQQPTPSSPVPQQKKPPRKLEMRLQKYAQAQSDVTFSAPFLDNTLSKMLDLQNRMLRVGKDIGADENVSEEIKQEQFKQSAELSRIIALICAEKARQGA
ncbi:hypothetical protein EJ05DRAFT_166652 [Pseudovirgaria hyperparasitica]|uniref:Uncharacterized protein n=1 Tax=Pseudovirgaria hyperparasitica TaxID=470096 RepID=A0A6A6VSJ2_9PEZI|nr:uncharacterized protein EJ05DRAFT_166652 [Pseudovirgaria hyperparasitica]KAF2753638.1 hypothetical protein EJ05DRAFT_166652 [Pseudovirgaria hyperparasitica]